MGNQLQATARTNLDAGQTLLTWWHLCSIDAPTVAAVWLIFAARSAAVILPRGLVLAMFLAVWIVYAMDRLLDARSAAGLEPRHHFHARHRGVFIPAIFAAGGLLSLMLAGGVLPHLLLERYLALAAGLLLWLAAVHLVSGSHALPKEIATGVFFSAAMFLPLLGAHGPLLVHALLFAGLCTLNCLMIRGWESDRHARALEVGAAALILAAVADWSSFGLAISLAAVLLLVLHRKRRAIEPTLLRAAADLVLLTPLLVGLGGYRV